MVASSAPGFAMRSRSAKTRFLDRHLLEHGLDHDIGRAACLERSDTGDAVHAAFHLGAGEPAAAYGRAVVGGYPVEALLQQVTAGFDNRDRDAGIGEAHRDAAAHCAGTDDRSRCNRPRLRRIGHTRYFRRLALGEKNVPLRLGLIAGDQLPKQLSFALQPLLEWQNDGVAHRLDAGCRRVAATQPPGQFLGGVRKPLSDELFFAVADQSQRPVLRDDTAGEGDRRPGQIAVGDLIDDTVRQRLAAQGSGRR